MSSYSRRFFMTGLLSLTACRRSLKSFAFSPASPAQEGLAITYFSVGCTKIRLGNRSILTDPFFSHLSALQVAFGEINSDPEQYTPYLNQIDGVDAVLVGHSHYDHTLDLPVVAPRLASHAKIFGSQTLKHTYAASTLPRPIVPVNALLATPNRHGKWCFIPEQHIRILPIQSGHPNQYLFVHLYTEKRTTDRVTPPSRSDDYQEGITIAYLIDFLDPQTGEIQARVYVQTSSTGFPTGSFPKDILEEHPVQVAILGMDCANIKAKNKPSIIDFLNPRAVVFCHWEDFFRPKSKEPKSIVRVDMHRLKEALPSTEERQYIFPFWDRTYSFPVD